MLVLTYKIYKAIKDGWLGAFYSLFESDNVTIEMDINL